MMDSSFYETLARFLKGDSSAEYLLREMVSTLNEQDLVLLQQIAKRLEVNPAEMEYAHTITYEMVIPRAKKIVEAFAASEEEFEPDIFDDVDYGRHLGMKLGVHIP